MSVPNYSSNPITVPSSISLTEQLTNLSLQYPAYHRAWKSMNTTYGVHVVTFDWRGTIGLMRFIEDTSSLPDSPTVSPEFAHTVKLKRKDSTMPFSLTNVYWSLTVAARKVQKYSEARKVQRLQYELKTPVQVMSAQSSSVEQVLEELKQLSPDELTSLHTSLLESEFAGVTLSASDEFKRKLLDRVVFEGVSLDAELNALVPIPPASKFEDI